MDSCIRSPRSWSANSFVCCRTHKLRLAFASRVMLITKHGDKTEETSKHVPSTKFWNCTNGCYVSIAENPIKSHRITIEPYWRVLTETLYLLATVSSLLSFPNPSCSHVCFHACVTVTIFEEKNMSLFSCTSRTFDFHWLSFTFIPYFSFAIRACQISRFGGFSARPWPLQDLLPR